MIRRIVLDPATGEMSPRAEALLYAADKAQHIFSVVRPALERGAIVVCDRYVDSMLAYQGAGRVLQLADLERIARWATEDLRADLTVVLDAELRDGVHAKSDKDRLESAGEMFHERTRLFFLELARREPERYLVLDARASREQIAARVAARLTPLLSSVARR
jgi:dTMP kinase